jgi:hypothetical protein
MVSWTLKLQYHRISEKHYIGFCSEHFKHYYVIMNYYSTVILIHAHTLLFLHEELLEFGLPVFLQQQIGFTSTILDNILHITGKYI